MIWAQHEKTLYYFAGQTTPIQAKAISKKFPDKIVVRINQDGEELTKHVNGVRISPVDRVESHKRVKLEAVK